MITSSQRIILGLIITTLLLPIPITLLIHLVHLSAEFNWIANRTLAGVTIKKERPQVCVASWMNGDLQKAVNSLTSEHFAGREALIRFYDQFLYCLFDRSYMCEGTIIDGKNHDLFGDTYLGDFGHYFKAIPNEEAEALAVMMRDLSKRLKELGSCFVFVITPSKTSLYPEDVPERFLTKLKSGDRQRSNYEILLPFLNKYQVPYVDGRQITIEHKEDIPLRAFAKTGNHWTRAVAFFTTAALLKTIERESGREMPELSESVKSIDGRPDDADDDLFGLLNLMEKPNQQYVHPIFRIPDNWSKRKGILTFVGGSFCGQIINDLEAAEVFERTNHYFYFSDYKEQYPGRILSRVDTNAMPWKEDFWSSDAVVVEANEQAIGWAPQLRSFLMVALMALERLPQERGIVDDPRPLSWAFGGNENVESSSKNAVQPPDKEVTWISDHQAQIDLPSPQEGAELELVLETKPFLADEDFQSIVKVDANEMTVGTLTLNHPYKQFCSLTLPAVANQNSSIRLCFSYSSAGRVVEHGKRFETGFARLALVPIRLPTASAIAGNNVPVLDRK
jgi:alginate O-acetyltransferase complex protein AlgJ